MDVAAFALALSMTGGGSTPSKASLLTDTSWLHDTFIQKYLKLLAKNNGRRGFYDLWFCDPAFSAQFGPRKPAWGAERKAKIREQVAGKDKLAIVCNPTAEKGGSHWTLSVVDMHTKRCSYFDSDYSVASRRSVWIVG